MESLESRELLSINPLGYDGSYDNSDTVQTSQTFAGESDFSTEVASASEVTATSCKVAWEASTDGTGLVKITLTPQGGGSSIVETVASSDITAAGSATISGLTAGTAYNITVEGATSAGTAQTSTVTTLAATGGGSAVTNSVGTTSGLTTDAVTITWTKPTVYTGGTNDVALKGAGNYTLTITNNANSADTITIDAATLKTKTSWATTGLTAGATYTFTVTTDKLTAKDGTAISASSTFVVATGEFTALAEGDAAKVTVGHPTDLKTAWTDKDKTVKVTWKAPANYTGGYTVTFTDKAMADAKAADSSAPAADTFIRTIAAGSKLELIVATGSAFSAATAGSELLAVDTFYNVEIKADVTNSITSKTICYTGKTAPAVNDPATPALKAESVAGAASATPGVVTVTITHNTSNVTGSVTDGTVGYYVGYDASATPTQPTDFSKFIYVAKASGTATKTTVDLVGDTKYAVVYAVAADGSVSAVTATTAALATGATAADEDGKYTALPASNATHTMIGAIGQNTTSVTFVADTTAKNSVKISGIAIPSAGVPVGTDATTTKPAAASDTLLKATGTLVSYSADGGTTWQSVALAADKTETTLTGLKWGTAYQFKVEVLFETYKAEAGSPADGVTPYTWETTATGPKGLGKAITKTLTIAAAPKVATPVKHATPVDLNTGTTATVQWTSVAGTNYQVKLIDANKAVLATDTITDGSGKWAITGLIPKGKYTVEVVALGTVPGTVSAPLKISVTAAEFLAPTIKDAKASTITDIKVTVTKNAKATGDQFYYVEYTSVTDAKGKPDWNAAKVVNNSADPTSIPPTGAAGDYTISKLNPGTQYFVRVVTTDKAYASGTAWSAMTKSVASKEVKIKTLAVPMATIQKPGFAMGGTNGTDFGFKFGVLTPNAAVKAGKLDLLNANDTFTYKLFVADASAKADKATGKLGGAVEIPESAFDDILANSTPDPKGKFQPTPTGVITFEALETALNDVGMSVANMKTLQFQLEVTYKAGTSKAGFNATDTYCTNYTKAAKLTMPKWFV